jgi:hypothetical protein
MIKMIIDAQRLKNILDLLLHTEFKCLSMNLEISKLNEEYLTIAVNYSDSYYISCIINISNEVNLENFNISYIVIPKDGLIKLYQIVGLWPKSTIKIDKINGLISIEVIKHGQLVRERPVYVECIFQPTVNDYIIQPPTMRYNCIVNSKNLKQMLEFCTIINGDIFLEIREKSLSIMSTDSSLATLVELEELVEKPSKKIKLFTEGINLIISFLNSLVSKFNLAYLLFIEEEWSFSIRIKFDDFTTIQIYTIHD